MKYPLRPQSGLKQRILKGLSPLSGVQGQRPWPPEGPRRAHEGPTKGPTIPYEKVTHKSTVYYNMKFQPSASQHIR